MFALAGYHETVARPPWLRLLAACGLSFLFHLAVLTGIPVNPTGGTPQVVSTISARLEEASAEPESAVPEAVPATEAADKVEAMPEVPRKAQEPPRTTAAQPTPAARAPASSPSSGLEIPLIRDPTYYPARQLDVYPQPLAPIQPKCPHDAIVDRVNGRVQLLLLIDEFGMVNEVSIAESQPPGQFDEAAATAFREAHFSAAQKQGYPVKSRVLLRVSFICSESAAAGR